MHQCAKPQVNHNCLEASNTPVMRKEPVDLSLHSSLYAALSAIVVASIKAQGNNLGRYVTGLDTLTASATS